MGPQNRLQSQTHTLLSLSVVSHKDLVTKLLHIHRGLGQTHAGALAVGSVSVSLMSQD